MTGRFVRRDAPTSAARLSIHLGDAVVSFEDPRRFGSVVVMTRAAAAAALVAGHGPDAWDVALDGLGLAARLPGRRPVHAALLDQANLAGVGNIHAAEALFDARIAPDRPAATLTRPEWDRLATSLRAQLARALDELGEDGDVAYVSGGGPNPFQVYGKAGAPCPRCGDPIGRLAIAGRSVFRCSRCAPSLP